jgi:hypothetical protein
VNASAGVVAFIARTITVNINATDKVVLRGLSMNGVVFGDADGIALVRGGTLVIENSVIAGFGNGVNQSAGGSNLIVNNCELRNNTDGVLNGTTSDTNSNVVIENSRFKNNIGGFIANGGTASISIGNSVFANNSLAVYAFSSVQTRPVLIVVDTSTIAHNNTGTNAEVFTPGSATISVTNSTIDHNTNGMLVSGGAGAAIQSYGNNRVLANTNGSAFSGTVLAMQ